MKTLAAIRPFSLSCLIAIISGCSTLSPAGLVAASRLDPLNTDPSQIAVAVGVPDEIRLEDGDAEIRMAFQGDSDTAPILREEIVPLQMRQSLQDGPTPNAADERVYVARIAAADAARIASLQREIRELRASGAKGQGSLSISVVGGCFVGELPRSIAVSTWLQTDPTGRLVPLTRRSDVSRAIGERDAAILRANLRPCGQ